MDNELTALGIIFTEFYYWVTVVFMFLIHVGFCMYEVGASRYKNHTHTLMKNTMLIPLVTITFFFFGWWIYFAFVNGPWTTMAMATGPTRSHSAYPRRRLSRGLFWPLPIPGRTIDRTSRKAAPTTMQKAANSVNDVHGARSGTRPHMSSRNRMPTPSLIPVTGIHIKWR